MIRSLLRRLELTHPELAAWLGDRFDLQVPAIGLSLVTHIAILLAFATMGYAVHTEQAKEFRTEVIETSTPDLSKLDDTTALAEVDQSTTLAKVAGAFSPNVSPLIVPPTTPPPMPEQEAVKLEVASAAKVVLPTATRLDQAISIRGSGSEHVGGVEGAVDRVAVEILRHLDEGRTLVIWAFDASGSLVAERERLKAHIEQVYAHIQQFDKQGLAKDGLLTVVVGFGAGRKALTAEPTSDPAAIAEAIGQVPLDTTGIESTFQTVAEIAHKWGKFKKGGKPYRPLTIVVTDEVGDDEPMLETAINAANAVKMPVFVLGSPALFARVDGYMDYTDPKTKQTYHNLPVRQGPESVIIESVRLPFWYDGPQYDVLDAGFGPYALSRLAGATGGIYFITRMGPNRITFDPAGMREYKPDWVSREQYVKSIARHPIRQAVLRSAEITQQNLPGQPNLNFPADPAAFKDAMEKNQEIVARDAYTIDAALEPIAAVAKLRDRETSRRWQAHYDLIRGRLLAMKIRCYEYNWACAKMKKDPLKFTKPSSNTWRLIPDEEIHYSDKAAQAAAEARSLLKRVINDHPGTPWALLAQRELKDPFGFKWVEAYVPPPPKPKEGPEANNKKPKPNNAPPPKPPELPKL